MERFLDGKLTGNKVRAATLHLSLGIVPFGAVRSAYRPTETFSIYGDQMVVVELVGAAVNITQPREISLYVKAFNELAAVAVHGEAARVLIANALDALR